VTLAFVSQLWKLKRMRVGTAVLLWLSTGVAYFYITQDWDFATALFYCAEVRGAANQHAHYSGLCSRDVKSNFPSGSHYV
jgi:hypothetical protein